jgi:hypothetical protein
VAEVDTAAAVAVTAARSVVDTEAAVVGAIANTDRTAVARATVVAVSLDTVAVASLDMVEAVVAALTVAAMAHKLLEATQATEARNRLMQQSRQSQP